MTVMSTFNLQLYCLSQETIHKIMHRDQGLQYQEEGFKTNKQQQEVALLEENPFGKRL